MSTSRAGTWSVPMAISLSWPPATTRPFPSASRPASRDPHQPRLTNFAWWSREHSPTSDLTASLTPEPGAPRGLVFACGFSVTFRPPDHRLVSPSASKLRRRRGGASDPDAGSDDVLCYMDQGSFVGLR